MRGFGSLFIALIISSLAVHGQGRLDSIVAHYWDGCEPTVLVPKDLFIGYSYLLSKTDRANAIAGLDSFIDKFSIDDEHAEWVLFLMESYLYHPESKYRDEYLFCQGLSRMKDCPNLSSQFRMTRKTQWEMLSNCLEGEPASDFTIALASGVEQQLSQFHAQYLLLVFYYPDCSRCHLLLNEMSASSELASKVRCGKLQVLAVYPLDAEDDSWVIKNLPEGWLNGYDIGQEVYSRRLYTLREIPSTYLLDESGTIVLKEKSWKQLETVIQEL